MIFGESDMSDMPDQLDLSDLSDAVAPPLRSNGMGKRAALEKAVTT